MRSTAWLSSSMRSTASLPTGATSASTGDADFATFRGVLDRVGEEVVEDLSKPPGIGHRPIRADACDDLQVFAVGQGPNPSQHLTNCRAEVQGLRVQLDPAGLDLGQIQDVVDELE